MLSYFPDLVVVIEGQTTAAKIPRKTKALLINLGDF